MEIILYDMSGAGSGVLRSTGYPGDYANNEFCRNVILLPANSMLILEIEDFEIENHPSCDFDYLSVSSLT
jgi:cubilin